MKLLDCNFTEQRPSEHIGEGMFGAIPTLALAAEIYPKLQQSCLIALLNLGDALHKHGVPSSGRSLRGGLSGYGYFYHCLSRTCERLKSELKDEF
jgi:hypothetical protein